MRIESERLYFRPLTMHDCTQRYVDWLNDPEVKRYLETRYITQTLNTVINFVEFVNQSSREHLFGIFVKDGIHIGNIKLGPVKNPHPLADVSLFIGDRNCWGKGYGAEAIEAISKYAFKTIGIKKLSASMYEPNRASWRAFVKANFRMEGHRQKHYLLDGKMVDILEYGLVGNGK